MMSPQTPTTVADTDELASADSTSGSDKTPVAAKEDDGNQASANMKTLNGMNQTMNNAGWQQCNMPMGQPWMQTNGCGNDNNMAMGFAPGPNCGMVGQQMMYFVQVPM